jgi:hypothetical protein
MYLSFPDLGQSKSLSVHSFHFRSKIEATPIRMKNPSVWVNFVSRPRPYSPMTCMVAETM